MQPDFGADTRIGVVMVRIIIEADGGSRGNPGPAAYGALIRDADTGQVIAERAEHIGVATNNVAEYRGLIAGLELLREHAPEADDIEVRMDSKLVVEQMAGRWKVKHPSMRPLAIQAQKIAPFGVQWTWVPREQNKAADAILNAALDVAQGKTPKPVRASRPAAASVEPPGDVFGEADQAAEAVESHKNPLIGWRARADTAPTTLILLRHGVTEHTIRKLFCGTGGLDPGLNAEGEQQAQRAAAYIKNFGEVDAIVSSPLRRTRETSGFVARELGLDVDIEPGIAEAAFGDWDGQTFADVYAKWPQEMEAWLASTAVSPPGGETFDSVYERVVVARNRLLAVYAGKTVVAVSHVTPIKMLVRVALDAPMHTIYKMELAPASITTIQWWGAETPSLRNFSVVP